MGGGREVSLQGGGFSGRVHKTANGVSGATVPKTLQPKFNLIPGIFFPGHQVEQTLL